MNNTNNKQTEILLGIDYGESRIGIAFGRQGLVSPVKIINAKNAITYVNEINRLAGENNVTKIVIGLPLTFDNKETTASRKVRHFARILRIYIKKPIVFVNEYGSTDAALDAAIANGIGRKSRKVIDHFSAGLILKNYFAQEN